MTNATKTTTRPAWEVNDVTSTVPDSAESLDAAFSDLEVNAGSSGWVCTLTIECGTVVCACQ